MKKVFIALTVAASVAVISSCSGGYTCPTYMKLEDKQMKKVDDTELVVEQTERV